MNPRRDINIVLNPEGSEQAKACLLNSLSFQNKEPTLSQMTLAELVQTLERVAKMKGRALTEDSTMPSQTRKFVDAVISRQGAPIRQVKSDRRTRETMPYGTPDYLQTSDNQLRQIGRYYYNHATQQEVVSEYVKFRKLDQTTDGSLLTKSQELSKKNRNINNVVTGCMATCSEILGPQSFKAALDGLDRDSLITQLTQVSEELGDNWRLPKHVGRMIDDALTSGKKDSISIKSLKNGIMIGLVLRALNDNKTIAVVVAEARTNGEV